MTKRDLKSGAIWIACTLAIYAVFQLLISMRILQVSQQIAWITIGINIILAVSLNLILGVAGQFSLGHAGFMSIGAYSVAITLQFVDGYLGFVLGILVGLCISAIVSLIVAIPTLRLKGDYLAIATLGISEIIRIIITNLTITNGAIGITGIPRHVNFTTVYIFVVFSVYILTSITRSRFGRVWKGIQEDEIASSSMGVPLTRYKVSAFLIGACFASISGALYASYFRAIQPGLFDFNKSVDILVIVVLGGMGSYTGSVIAAIVIGLINLVFQGFAQERVIIYSILLIAMMILRPKGLLGSYELSFKRLFGRKDSYGNTKG
ncbi:branched-chain amino acid ABC transporter permease [Erysipelothrix larvae]|uniref:Branched-chain amino acid ABC transporter permease n=1 Tax=Erysipelothrix larvae TaxID=1514105 RepID=A0A109UGY5_9FIRM|nr:branched-chain amino acid ABC transporter permease [Erysipelothrix larvae]AMC93405.1 branched-chain amino acid ABC transporter permease [Erysipelothrix larvae]